MRNLTVRVVVAAIIAFGCNSPDAIPSFSARHLVSFRVTPVPEGRVLGYSLAINKKISFKHLSPLGA